MRRNIKQGVAAIRQRMLILHYQRLYLFSLFYSGRSDHPLLAIHTSELLSKPNTSPSTLLIILYFIQKNKIKILQKFYQKLFTFVIFLYTIYSMEFFNQKKKKGAIANENINANMGISTKNCRRNCTRCT